MLFCIIQKKKTLFFETDTFLKRIRFVTVFFSGERSLIFLEKDKTFELAEESKLRATAA